MAGDARLSPVMLNQLVRYSAAISLLEGLRGGTLLEVGSGSEGIVRFLGEDQGWNITVSDLDFSDYGAVEVNADDGLERVEADVTDLPFGDRQFDVVLALDLLEHLPPGERTAALQQLARVSDKRLIVGCPCGRRALKLDRLLAAWYRLLPRRSVPVWLIEHLENGFPDAEDLTRDLLPFGSVELHRNEWLWTHLAISMLEAMPVVVRGTLCGAARLGGDVGRASRPRHARSIDMLRGWDREPAYRQIAVMTPRSSRR